MSSLYAEYIKEREDFETVEDEYGFATYKIINNEVYLRDIFTLKEYRQLSMGKKLAEKVMEIAKEKGCTKLLGTVVPSALGSSLSMKLFLSYGMKLKSSSNDFIILEMDL